MQKNPNVKINVEFTDWTGYWDKLSAMAAGGNLPDIIQQDYAYITQWHEKQPARGSDSVY
jgi:multiple sugar transport system substrate-binding protein